VKFSVRLTLVFIALAGFSTGAALIVQDRALEADLEATARQHAVTAAGIAETLVGLHLEVLHQRYIAIAGTPQFRATLGAGDRPTLGRYAKALARQEGASQVLFAGEGSSVLAVGVASTAVPPQWPEEGASLVNHDGHPFVVVAIPLRIAGRFFGRLVVSEPVREQTLTEWSEAAGAEILFGLVQRGGDDVMEVAFTPERGVPLTVRVPVDRDVLAHSRWNLLVAGLVALIGAALASMLVSRRLVEVIHEIKAAAERIGTGDFAARVRSDRRDEFGDVARSINEMAARLEALDVVQGVLDGLPDAVMVVDGAGAIVRFNEQAGSLGAVDGENWSSLLDPESRPRAARLLADVAVGHSKRDWIETRLAAASSQHLWEVVPLGRRLLISGRDITDHKQSQEEGARYAREAAQLEVEAGALRRERELTELKSHFVAMASHELRTPLAAILSASDVMKRYGSQLTDDERHGRLDTIQSEVRHMTGLVEEVLTLSRQRSGQFRCVPQSVDIDALCEDIVEEMAGVAAEARRIVLHKDGRRSSVHLDPGVLKQILTNLLENALKYSPAGEDVDLHVVCDAGSSVFRVRDRGIGIPEAEQEALFEPFHRATNVGSIPGTGLGLAIAKEAVELHGGTIGVESEPGVGTTIIVSIPSGAMTRDDDVVATA